MQKSALSLAFAALVASPALASTFAPTKVACPVGGKKFEYMAYMSYSTFGRLPDGQPIGSAAFPLALPQCPDNGLVLYRDFDDATVVRLTPLVLGEEYQRLRKTETRYYLAQWLSSRLGESEQETIWTLLSATWEAKNGGDPARADRYNTEFVTRALALKLDPTSIDSLVLRLRAVNALRELGRFDEARTALTAVSIAPDAGEGEDAPKQRQAVAALRDQLSAPINRQDRGRAPIDLLDERQAASRCIDPEFAGAQAPPPTAFEQQYCARPEIAAQAAIFRRNRGK